METDYAEENISTEQPPTREKARIQGENGDEKRPRRAKAPPSERPQAVDGSTLLNFSFPKETRLARRAEFLRVYEHGRRFEGRYMTVFVLPSVGSRRHRVGVTATKKAIGTKAHDRNRAKRLLREAFRLSKLELDAIDTKFDWVLNARRSILTVKLEAPLREFRLIAAKVCAAGDSVPRDVNASNQAE